MYSQPNQLIFLLLYLQKIIVCLESSKVSDEIITKFLNNIFLKFKNFANSNLDIIIKESIKDLSLIPKKIPSSNQYFAAQSLPWRAFFLKELNLKDKYKIKFIEPFSDFAFLLSGGYSYYAFYPKFLYSFIKLIDKMLTSISIKIFSARMLIVLEKN